ncbi:MAG: zinc ribbon domain-containing protein [Anaerotruncus sp.]|nr:zinc ribbon domain-containing protein [Anaerotruncus sp.]
MIIKPMAITRCPYCHAIIDENDKYCNNCGTQLLFTEDEEIEEEIPGEKIIDAEVEEKDYTVDEPEDEKRPAAAKDLDTRDRRGARARSSARRPRRWPSTSSSPKRRAGKPADDVTEEVILVDEIAASEAKDKDGSARSSRTRARPEPKKDEEEDEEDEDEDDEDEEDEKEDGAEEPDKEKDDEEDDEDEDIEEEDIAPAPAKEPQAVTPGEGTTEIPEPLGASGEVADVEYVIETGRRGLRLDRRANPP